MTEQPELVRVGADRLEEAAGIVTRAFVDDPGALYMYPDSSPEERVTALLPAFRRGLEASLGDEVAMLSDRPDGVIVWERLAGPFDHGEAPSEPPRDAVAERARHVVGAVNALHDRVAQGPHWHLVFLAVLAESRGQGRASALIRPGLERADREGLPCILETFTQTNVAVYRHWGFDVVESAMLPNGWPLWAMRRPPPRSG